MPNKLEINELSEVTGGTMDRESILEVLYFVKQQAGYLCPVGDKESPQHAVLMETIDDTIETAKIYSYGMIKTYIKRVIDMMTSLGGERILKPGYDLLIYRLNGLLKDI